MSSTFFDRLIASIPPPPSLLSWIGRAVCDQRKEGLKAEAAAAVWLFLPIVYPEIDLAAAKEKQGSPT